MPVAPAARAPAIGRISRSAPSREQEDAFMPPLALGRRVGLKRRSGGRSARRAVSGGKVATLGGRLQKSGWLPSTEPSGSGGSSQRARLSAVKPACKANRLRWRRQRPRASGWRIVVLIGLKAGKATVRVKQHSPSPGVMSGGGEAGS
eukprot:349785-Chlamydomonas_euryale.AAC.8